MDIRRMRVFRDFVVSLAALSKCEDKGVATIITDSEGTQVYSIGINGGPRHGVDCLCTLGGKYTCVHAEANAIAKCTAADREKVFFCSFSPCVTCAALIVNSGASAVYYVEKYKDDVGLQILKRAGIYVACISEDAFLEKAIATLQRKKPVRLCLRDTYDAALLRSLAAYANARHIDALYTYLQYDDAGPKYAVVRWVNYNG